LHPFAVPDAAVVVGLAASFLPRHSGYESGEAENV
jgi:hypothetical protein